MGLFVHLLVCTRLKQATRTFWNMLNTIYKWHILQDSCKLKFHLTRILQDDVYLARILQETCQKNALSCKILQDILQDSCKLCIFFQLGTSPISESGVVITLDKTFIYRKEFCALKCIQNFSIMCTY